MPNTPDYCRSIVHSAARTVEERDLLAAIVDSPLDEMARKNYWEWLRLNGDKLETQARIFSDVVSEIRDCDDADPPEFWFWRRKSGFPKAWMNMVGVPLIEAVTENRATWELRDLVFKYANPRLGITAEAVGVDNLPLHGSRFGGRAALPDDVAWPECKLGPLAFIAQIALSEISTTQVARFLPPDGWLSFFAFNEHIGGNGGNYDGHDLQVLYTPSSKHISVRESPEKTEFRDLLPCRLIFTETWDLPDGDVVICSEDQERIDRTWSAHSVDLGKIRGGFGVFDGHLLGDLRHYRTNGVARSPTDRNLLCLASTCGPGWNWCDGDHLSVYIENDDLISWRFHKIGAYAG
jgi:uncharacterized protein YwqG